MGLRFAVGVAVWESGESAPMRASVPELVRVRVRVRVSAPMRASVPELVKRTISTAGTASMTWRGLGRGSHGRD